MAKKKEIEGQLVLPVAYSNVNVGDKKASVHCTISRANLTVAQADKNFTERRLRCNILARPSGASSGQGSLPGLEGEDIEMSGIADVTGFSAGGKTIKIGLSFAVNEIDVPTLARFAKRERMLTVVAVGAIPSPPPGEKKSKKPDDGTPPPPGDDDEQPGE